MPPAPVPTRPRHLFSSPTASSHHIVSRETSRNTEYTDTKRAVAISLGLLFGFAALISLFVFVCCVHKRRRTRGSQQKIQNSIDEGSDRFGLPKMGEKFAPYLYAGTRPVSRDGHESDSEGCCDSFCIACCGVKRGVAVGRHGRRPRGYDHGMRRTGGYDGGGRTGRGSDNYSGGGSNDGDGFEDGGCGSGVGRIYATYAEETGYRNTSTRIMEMIPRESPGRSQQRRISPNRRRHDPREAHYDRRRQVRHGRSSSRELGQGARRVRTSRSRKRRPEDVRCDPDHPPEISRPYHTRQRARTPPGNYVERIPRAPYNIVSIDRTQTSNSDRERGSSRRRLLPPPPPTSDSYSEISYPETTYHPNLPRQNGFIHRLQWKENREDRDSVEDKDESNPYSTELDSEYRSLLPPVYTETSGPTSYSSSTPTTASASHVAFTRPRPRLLLMDEVSATSTIDIISSGSGTVVSHPNTIDSTSTPDGRGVSTASKKSDHSCNEYTQASSTVTSSQIQSMDSGVKLEHLGLINFPSSSQRSLSLGFGIELETEPEHPGSLVNPRPSSQRFSIRSGTELEHSRSPVNPPPSSLRSPLRSGTELDYSESIVNCRRSSSGSDTITHMECKESSEGCSGSSLSISRSRKSGTSSPSTTSIQTSSSRPQSSRRYILSSPWVGTSGPCMTRNPDGLSTPLESKGSHRTWSHSTSNPSSGKVSRSPSGSTSSIRTIVPMLRPVIDSHSATPSSSGSCSSEIYTEISSSADETPPPSTCDESSMDSISYPCTPSSASSQPLTDDLSPSYPSSVYSSAQSSPSSQSGRSGVYVTPLTPPPPPQLEYAVAPVTPPPHLTDSSSGERAPNSLVLSPSQYPLPSSPDQATPELTLTPHELLFTTSTQSTPNLTPPSSTVYHDTASDPTSQSNTPSYAVSLISTFIPVEDLLSELKAGSAAATENPPAEVPRDINTRDPVLRSVLQVDGTRRLSVVGDGGVPVSNVSSAAVSRYRATVESVVDDSDDTGGVGVA